jgi:hypothetical protein
MHFRFKIFNEKMLITKKKNLFLWWKSPPLTPRIDAVYTYLVWGWFIDQLFVDRLFVYQRFIKGRFIDRRFIKRQVRLGPHEVQWTGRSKKCWSMKCPISRSRWNVGQWIVGRQKVGRWIAVVPNILFFSILQILPVCIFCIYINNRTTYVWKLP